MVYQYIEIIQDGEKYIVYNKVYKQNVGEIRKERIMGQWMQWQLFQYPDCGFSNGCLKEVSSFITKLYGKDRTK